jgi:hypothetical protein
MAWLWYWEMQVVEAGSILQSTSKHKTPPQEAKFLTPLTTHRQVPGFRNRGWFLGGVTTSPSVRFQQSTTAFLPSGKATVLIAPVWTPLHVVPPSPL